MQRILWLLPSPSFPPTTPNSASTVAPYSFAVSTTPFTVLIFSSSGKSEPSSITDVKPISRACSTVSTFNPWSRCTAISTLAFSAAEIIIGPINSKGELLSLTSAICKIIGASSSSAALTAPITISILPTEKAPMATPFSSARASNSFIATSDKNNTYLSKYYIQHTKNICIIITRSGCISMFEAVKKDLQNLYKITRKASLA